MSGSTNYLQCGFCAHSGDTQCDCSIYYSIDLNNFPKKTKGDKKAKKKQKVQQVKTQVGT